MIVKVIDRLSHFSTKNTSTNVWFQLLKCEDFLLYCVIYHTEYLWCFGVLFRQNMLLFQENCDGYFIGKTNNGVGFITFLELHLTLPWSSPAMNKEWFIDFHHVGFLFFIINLLVLFLCKHYSFMCTNLQSKVDIL